MDTINGTLNDITDGQMWKNFIVYEGQPFLDLPNNIVLALNIDSILGHERMWIFNILTFSKFQFRMFCVGVYLCFQLG